jgi:diguanylate cyclase (GGDEF)-like protein
MLDLMTLQVAQAAVALCALVFVYASTYRTVGTPYSGWWSAALVVSGLSNVVALAVPDAAQLPRDSVANALAVMGAAFIYQACRSLRLGDINWKLLSLTPLAVLVTTLAAGESGEGTPAEAVFFLAMSALLALASVQLFSLLKSLDEPGKGDRRNSTRPAVALMSVVATFMSAFTGVRAVVNLVPESTSSAWREWFGPEVTALIVLVLLVLVTATVTELSHFEVAREWRRRATQDDLTGLMTRSAFSDVARERMEELTTLGTTSVVAVADFDDFKSLNDVHGHAAGDRALAAFGDACRAHLDEQDLAARAGGDEFVLLLHEVSVTQALTRVGQLSEYLRTVASRSGVHSTISFGLTTLTGDEELDAAVRRADSAVYRAKREGRDRAVVDSVT